MRVSRLGFWFLDELWRPDSPLLYLTAHSPEDQGKKYMAVFRKRTRNYLDIMEPLRYR